mgnify:FL=1
MEMEADALMDAGKKGAAVQKEIAFADHERVVLSSHASFIAAQLAARESDLPILIYRAIVLQAREGRQGYSLITHIAPLFAKRRMTEKRRLFEDAYFKYSPVVRRYVRDHLDLNLE